MTASVLEPPIRLIYEHSSSEMRADRVADAVIEASDAMVETLYAGRGAQSTPPALTLQRRCGKLKPYVSGLCFEHRFPKAGIDDMDIFERCFFLLVA
jgi:hypothetical protein